MIQKDETSIVVARNTRVSCVDLGFIYNELSLHFLVSVLANEYCIHDVVWMIKKCAEQTTG